VRERREPVITIDGPAGAGKSTAAREVARRLGFKLVDTGSLYRALAWAVARAGVNVSDETALEALLARTHVELAGDHVLVDGIAKLMPGGQIKLAATVPTPAAGAITNAPGGAPPQPPGKEPGQKGPATPAPPADAKK